MDPRDPRDESNDPSARQEASQPPPPQEAPAPPAERLAALDRRLAEMNARREERLEAQRQEFAEMNARQEERLEAQRQELAEMNARQEERRAAQAARPVPPPVDPREWITTVAEARQMAAQDVHRSWFHAAYADLSQRLTKMDERLDELEATLSLLHAKMETLIMRLAMDEEDPDA